MLFSTNWMLVYLKLISGLVDRASATEAVESGSIPGWVKPKTIKIGTGNYSFSNSRVW